MKTVVVIPARLQSTRLPNKLLLELGGKSIIQRVYEQCLKAERISGVYIAVDHEDLKKHCEVFSDTVIVTGNHHQSGTDRIAEAILNVDCDAVINVQGDEPFIDPKLISELAFEVQKNSMVSAMCPIKTAFELKDYNNVKVTIDKNSKAIYFSRSVIPFNRDGVDFDKLSYYKHLGIYGENGHDIKMVITPHNAIGIDTLEDYNNAKKLI